MSSETKHTPGPWAVVVPPAGTMQRARVYGPSNPNDGGHYAPLCKLSNVSDARLIAAAPDLLGLLEEWTADQTECGCDTAACQGNCLPARSRAAIAKATGQEG